MAQSLDPTGHIVAMPKGQRTRRSVGMWCAANIRLDPTARGTESAAGQSVR